MTSETHRRDTIRGLQDLAMILRYNPELPLYEFGPLTVEYFVLADSPEAAKAEFDQHARHLREVAENEGMPYTEEHRVTRAKHTHHTADLLMHGGQVRYRVLWIDKSAPKPEPEPVVLTLVSESGSESVAA